MLIYRFRERASSMAKNGKIKRTGPPIRRPNEETRGREWLTAKEVDKLRRAASMLGRHGERDSTMILEAFRHGLRVSELVAWRWDQVDLDAGTVYVSRRKGSKSGMHTLERDEIAALKKLAPLKDRTGVVFRSEREGPISESAFFKLLTRAAKQAEFDFPVHPHMLRHACGFELARAGKTTRLIQDWLGHRNIQHTVRYTEMDPDRFRTAKMWGGSANTKDEDE
jgi:type 1 fimbriae regulatory protein FimE